MTRRAGAIGLVAALAGLLLAAAAAHAARVTDFADTGLEGWNRRDFTDRTRYRLVETDAGTVLEATSDDSASALYREIEVDLQETPWLRWSWRLEALPTGEAGETTKAGDDYAARVYLVQEGLFGQLSATALNYVHARRQPVGEPWANAYTGDAAMMWAVSRGAAGGQWRQYTRNVRADWQAAFGEAIERIDGVAIMTDSDDTDTRAHAFYGTIRFCAQRDCQAE